LHVAGKTAHKAEATCSAADAHTSAGVKADANAGGARLDTKADARNGIPAQRKTPPGRRGFSCRAAW